MATGFDSTTYDRNAWLREGQSVIYTNNWVFDQTAFEIVDPANTPGGTRITYPIDYNSTYNGGTYDYDEAMPISDDLSSVVAYFNKDAYQGSARAYLMQIAQRQGNYDGMEITRDTISEAIKWTSKNIRDDISTTVVTDLIAQIDSAGNFSDAALSRATYGLTSYETAVGGALTIAALEDMIEGLQSPSYGAVPAGDLVFLMAINQFTNLSRLGTGASTTYTLSASSDNTNPIDFGRQFRMENYNGIPILVIPDMSTTDILLVNKEVIKFYEWRTLAIADKTDGVMADQTLYHLKMGLNGVCLNPNECGKLSTVTA